MSNLKSLPEIIFVDASAEEVENSIIKTYEAAAGRTLGKADPVRLFLLTIANAVVLLKHEINYTGKQNLLRYASGINLDHIGALMGCERTPASPAVTTIKITLSGTLNINTSIPSGTRFTAGDNVFFALDELLVIPAGETEAECQATCTESGIVGNGYLPGQIRTLVDPIAYVKSIENVTTSDGGAEIEDDENYREDIHKAPESFSTAGPTGAYEYWATRASERIIDVSVISPEPGVVEVRPLLENGEIPGQQILTLVESTLNNRSIRPLTDKVNVLAPTAEKYDINLTYYIDKSNTQYSGIIQTAVNNAIEDFIKWQCGKLARDINPSELISRVVTAGAKRVEVVKPTFKVLNGKNVAKIQSKTISFGGFEDD